jgi:prolyl oligopeptidase PreP (S9A serine peptidase family)
MIRNRSLTLGIYSSLFLLNLHQSILALAQDTAMRRYPATLTTTGDHDDRVVPGHSYKFAARLQSCQSGTRPTLIRIETCAGHGAGTPVSKLIDTAADTLAFVWKNFGLE